MDMITDYYTLSATVYSIVESINELGPDEASTQFTVVVNIDCALETVGKDERFMQGTDVVFATHRLYCGITDSILRFKRITLLELEAMITIYRRLVIPCRGIIIKR
jgi:hypothetical protein